MNGATKLIAATFMTTAFGLIAGCEPQTAGGGYHSTSSAQNVGSRSSNGTFGGTSDDTSRAGGMDTKNAPATPYSTTAPSGAGGSPTSNDAKIGPQNP